MGIRGLYSHISLIKNSWRIVNIADELQKYKIENERNPVLIINLWTLSNHFLLDPCDKLFGARLNEVKSEFENFLINLRNNGAELIFTFKKSQHKEWDFNESTEDQYKSGCEILDTISVLKETDKVVRHFERKRKFYFLSNPAVIMTLAQTASKYGELYGFESIDGKPSTIHAQLANKHKAMAMVGTETYYVFYEGSWKYWSDKDLDMKTMTTREYNKEVILNHLQINTESAPLYVALAGCLYSTEETIKKMIRYFKPWRYKIFENVSEFLSRQKFPLTDQSLNSIITEIFGEADPQIFADFRRTFDLMNPNIERKIQSTFDDKIVETFENDFLNFGNQILLNGSITLPVAFMDLRCKDMMPIKDLVAPWIQKTAGILLKYQNDIVQTTMIIKEKHDEKPIQIKIDPIFPNFDVPSLPNLATQEVQKNDSIRMMEFVCNINFKKQFFEHIPEEQLCNVIILHHLIRSESLKMFEAKLVLQTIVDVNNGKVPSNMHYPVTINERALRVSFLFSKLFFALHSCLASIGLKRYQTDFLFDNVYFQKLYEVDSKIEKSKLNDNEILQTLQNVINA